MSYLMEFPGDQPLVSSPIWWQHYIQEYIAPLDLQYGIRGLPSLPGFDHIGVISEVPPEHDGVNSEDYYSPFTLVFSTAADATAFILQLS